MSGTCKIRKEKKALLSSPLPFSLCLSIPTTTIPLSQGWLWKQELNRFLSFRLQFTTFINRNTRHTETGAPKTKTVNYDRTTLLTRLVLVRFKHPKPWSYWCFDSDVKNFYLSEEFCWFFGVCLSGDDRVLRYGGWRKGLDRKVNPLLKDGKKCVHSSIFQVRSWGMCFGRKSENMARRLASTLQMGFSSSFAITSIQWEKYVCGET